MLRRAVDAVAGGLVGWRWPAKLALAAAPSEVERGHIRHACPRSKRSQVRVLSDVPPGKNPQNFRSKRSEGHFRPPVFPYSRQVVYLISGKGSDKPVRSGKAAKMTTSKRRLSGVEKRTVIDTYPTGSLRERYLLRHQARASPPATIARYCMTFLLFDRFLKATERKVKSRILTTEVMQAFSVWLEEEPVCAHHGPTVRSLAGIQAPRLSTVKQLAAAPFMATGRASTEAADRCSARRSASEQRSIAEIRSGGR